MSGYAGRMPRFLARLAILIAVLLMPAGMVPAGATAHADRALAAMPMGHCDQQPPMHQHKGAVAECTMACSAALPAVDASRAEPPMIVCLPMRPAAAQVLHGLHPETATPPPKRS